jgi:hypothetical protein
MQVCREGGAGHRAAQHLYRGAIFLPAVGANVHSKLEGVILGVFVWCCAPKLLTHYVGAETKLSKTFWKETQTIEAVVVRKPISL